MVLFKLLEHSLVYSIYSLENVSYEFNFSYWRYHNSNGNALRFQTGGCKMISAVNKIA